ncbi:riboflavin synthase [Saprospiraceae bacterium]|jgi:riboflavin synthase|nr:riboflavin synthase [Bacteroidota bacterium]MDB4728417.1 riboflavin synthase [Saprospiraceae bacterium]MDF1863436.1 riboflavin synthase [Saprospiraceae bacterium]
MFTGIIESLGKVKKLDKEGTNVHLTIESSISNELKIDQSLAHNGVCLTVVELSENTHVVTAIEETMNRSNLGDIEVGTELNLERAMITNARLDGHMIQGHVDKTGTCVEIKTLDGSWEFTFQYELSPEHLLVDKGSICVNGVSLTVVNPTSPDEKNQVQFSVAIIPYTFEHTNFKNLKIGDNVNLEFDIIGKYISKYLSIYTK